MNFPSFLTILGIVIPLIHVSGLACAAHAAMFTRTSQGAIAWALSLIFFPYIAVPLYFVFGRRKFLGYVDARRHGDRLIDHVLDAREADLQSRNACIQPKSDQLHALAALAQLPFTQGNTAALLIDGEKTFHEIFAAIDAAQSYLLVQFFIVRDDALGHALSDRLIAKAAAGVRVYFLYDEIGCIRLSQRFIHALTAAGVQMKPFNTRRGWKNRFQINFRNHRKIVIADGLAAYVGGHNVGIEYLGKLPRFGPWRDTHIALRGPVVSTVEWSFIQDWHWTTGEILQLPSAHNSSQPQRPSPPTAEPTPNPQLPITNYQLQPPLDALVIGSGPADLISTCPLMFLAAISAARKRLWITSPYFVPDETVYHALLLAAIRGVDVRIMLPDNPDHLLVYLSSFSYLESAETAGVRFYRYQKGFLHQKVMLIDDDLAAVGTANLDNRSLRLNFEMTIFLSGRPFADQVAAMLEADFAHCERATPGDLRRRSLPFRIAVQTARLLSPVQ